MMQDSKNQLSRAQVTTLFSRLRQHLTPAVAELTDRLLKCVDEHGQAPVAQVHKELFPLAETKSASAQFTTLLKKMGEAANKISVQFSYEFKGSKQGGIAARGLIFLGPRPALQADTESVNAIPPEQMIQGQQAVLISELPRLALMTFNDHEYQKTCAIFTPASGHKSEIQSGVAVTRLGQHGLFDVVLYHSPQGTAQAQRAANDLANAWQPCIIIAVGIAFGIDEEKQTLSDVLVSDYLIPYELGKMQRGYLKLRGGNPQTSKHLRDAFRHLNQTRRNAVDKGTWPELRFGGILSGEKLVDDEDYRDNLKQIAGNRADIVGGEMEGAGLYFALEGRPIEWIVIKAICDWADGDKAKDKKRRQENAAETAAFVVKALIDHGLTTPHSWKPVTLPETKNHSVTIQSAKSKQLCLRPHLLDTQSILERDKHFIDNAAQEISLDTLDPERATVSDDRPRINVLNDVLAWATETEGPKLYALLGEYGMGKTITCQRAYQELTQQREAGEQVPIALYFDLRKVTRLTAATPQDHGKLPSLKETIEDCLSNGYVHEGGEAPSYEDVLTSINQGAVVLFDGLDEVLTRLSDRQGLTFTENLKRIQVEAQQRKAPIPKILISCRTQFFRNLTEQHNRLTGEHRGAHSAAQFRAAILLPLEESQIKNYLQALFGFDDAEEKLRLIYEVHNLSELAQRPFTLKLVTRFIPRIEQWRVQGRVVNGATLYREVAREWLIRDKEKQAFKPEVKERLAADLASYLWRGRQRGMSAEALEDWLAAWLAQQPSYLDFQLLPRDLLQEDLRNSTFLKRSDDADGRSYFEFAHTSMQEFFVADSLRRALQENGAGRAAWALPMVSDETLDFLGQMLAEEPALIQTLNKWRSTYLAQASELQLAYGLRAYRRKWPRIQLDNMVLAGADLCDWHFGSTEEEPQADKLAMQAVDFTGAKLRRAKFWNVNLHHARFDQAKLPQAELLNCQLANASWVQAEIDGYVVRPYPLTQIPA